MRSGFLRRPFYQLGLILGVSFLFGSPGARANTITVTTTSDAIADDGMCTFREAIVAANTNMASGVSGGECGAGASGLDTIEFAIPGAGVQRIRPSVTLQAITEPVFIDGYSQAGTSPNTNPMNAGINAVVLIELYGDLSGGLHLSAGASGSTIRGLSIHGGGDAIQMNASNVTIAGNFLGTNPAGTAGESLPSNGIQMQSGDHNVIGGPAAADRNLVSGYRSGSIEIGTCDATLVQGNYIGTNAAGTVGLQDLSATPYGVQTDPLSTNTSILGNLISGNASGINGYGPSVIQGNLIGTQKDGMSPLPNVTYGIFVDGNGHLVGSTIPGLGNTIAFNGFGLDFRTSSFGNRITGNSIHSSTHLGIGLDAFTFNPLANDACDTDTLEGNRGQNYPVITSALISGGSVTISGTLNSAAATTFRVEFFSDVACNASGHGEGRTYIGFTDVTTDPTCDGSFGPVVFSVPGGQAVFSATATDPAGNTSEFSSCITGGGDVVVSSISPTSGPASGFPGAVLAGASFAAGAAVTVGGVGASGVVVNSPTQITMDVPALAPGVVYPVTVTEPGPASGTLTNGWFADFLDVAGGLPFHPFVEKLVRNAITAGCGGGNYCPGSSVTRAQMAVFLLRAKDGPAYTPPACIVPAFNDVPCSSGFAIWVNELALRGVTAGCGGGNYCPSSAVTRDQMAVFLLVTKEGSAYSPPACVVPTFTDVPCASGFAKWIDELAARGITAGCGGGNYCPASAVTRGQMAVFLSTTFGLP